MLDGMGKNVNIDNMDFNSLDIDKSVSFEEYKARIIQLLQPILDNRFPNDRAKREIRPHTDRITFSCPICYDSMQSSWKQRGNIILSGKYINHYKCFNCNTYKGINEFFNDFKVDLQLDVINYITQTQENFTTSTFAKYDISLLLDVKTIEEFAIGRQELKQRFNLIEAKDSPAWPWLTKRLQYEDQKFLYSSSKNYILILNLTPSGKILGFQKRNFGKWQTKYLTFTLPTIYVMVNRTEKIPDEIDSLSQLYGICFLDFNKEITLFEGPFDSFLFKNSVANGGANKGFPIDLNLRYWYDRDNTGIKKSIEKIKEGSSVFLWEKFNREVGLPYRKKWDLTDCLVYLKENNIDIPNFENYFSKDLFDLIDI